MNLIFAGTPEFARTALDELIAQGNQISLVLTQPDRPAGRGMKLQPSPVKQLATKLQIPLLQPKSLKLDSKYAQEALLAQQLLTDLVKNSGAQAMVVAAYGLILPQWTLDLMQSNNGFGCLNIHASLLPRWRGAAPIHRAIEAGDSNTGITIMQMDQGLDTGAILMQQSIVIDPIDTTGSLHNKLAVLGGELINKSLSQIGELKAVAQPLQGINYANKISKSEALIDWAQDSTTIERKIRAFNPFPGAYSILNGHTIKIWQANILENNNNKNIAGSVLQANDNGVFISCGKNGQQQIKLTKLQKAGGKILDVADFIRGFPINPGEIFKLI